MKNLFKPLSITLLCLVLMLALGVCALAAESETAAASEEPAETVELEEATETLEESVPASELFTDLDRSENPETLRAMIDGGYIFGFTDGTFRPGRSYTRLELAQLAAALCSLQAEDGYTLSFYDCDIAGADAISAVVSAGLMTGRSSDSFDPYGSVLKAEMIGTMEKCAELLALEDYYNAAEAGFAAWITDYTICTADEAMQCAYALVQAIELKATAEAEAAAAALSAAIASDEMASDEMASDEMASGEPEEAAAETDTTEIAETSGEMDAVNTASGEPAESESASGEPDTVGFTVPTKETETAETAEETEEESSTPPAGVITPETQAASAAQAVPAQTQTTTPETQSAPEEYDESDALRDAIKGKYRAIRSQIVDYLLGILG